MENYGILLVDGEAAHHAILAALVAPHGFSVERVEGVQAVRSAIGERRYGLILVDVRRGGGEGADLIVDMRGAADWARTVPILAFMAQPIPDGERQYADAGFDGWLPEPLTAAELEAALRRWLGAGCLSPVGAPPAARLAGLLGEAAAAGLIERFNTGLEEAVAEVDAGADARTIGHRLGGLAGTLGFAVLSAAWLSLEHGAGEAWPTVRALTLEAVARHRAASSLPGDDSVRA